MSYSTVMVHVDLGSPGSMTERRVKLAGSLADSFDARLIGVAAQPCYLPVSGIATACAPGLVENEQDRIRDELAQAEAVFRRGAGARNRIEWRSAISLPVPFIAEQARAADLIVVSRQAQSDASAWRFGVSPEELVLTVGRPVLIACPYDNDFSAQRVIVAWKDTREARRAVSDALPLLKAAKEVFVVAIGDETRRAARIVYCKDDDRPGQHEHIAFDFLGYTFQPRRAKNRWGRYFVSFLPAISTKAATAIRQTVRGWRMASTRNNQRLEDLARLVNPVVRGWLNYYGRFYRSRCVQVLRHVNEALGKWAQRKYTRFRRRERAAMHWLGRIARRDPDPLK